jgi:hypothetical protein
MTRGLFAEIVRAAAPPLLVATATGVLLCFPPAENNFYPRCPIYESLHLQCPGCGSTRALAAMLHGNFNEAIHLNGLATLFLPIAAVAGFRWYYRFVRREVDHWPQVPRAAIYAAFAVAIMFTVVRNLPLGHVR